ncbi:MAG: hypothetical protein U0350_40750 [Caldilineaceae bacterium]
MIQPKRDVLTTCPCGRTFHQDGIGRMRVYCSAACKQRAHRKKHASPKRTRRQTYTVRRSTFERVAGLYAAKGQYDGVAAIEYLASQLWMDLDQARIENYRKQFTATLDNWLFRPTATAGQNVTVDDSSTVTKSDTGVQR